MSITKKYSCTDLDNYFQRSSDVENVTTKPDWDDKEFFIKKIFETNPKKGCEIIFRQYYNSLCSYTIRFVYSREVAEDIVGETFYKFWKNEVFKKISISYRAYLFICVRNNALKYLKREFGKALKNNLHDDMDYISCQPSPQEILQFQELSIKIEKAINSLPPQNQKIFLMSRIEGKKYAEISQELMLSQKTIEAHLSKALGILRKTLRNELVLLIMVFLF